MSVGLIMPFQHWRISFFISYGLKEIGAKCINCPVIILKDITFCILEGVDLKFGRTKNNTLGQGVQRVSTHSVES